MNKKEIHKLLEDMGRTPSPRMRVVMDTSDFMTLNPGDVMILNDTPYLITRNEKEVGFGMDDDPKFWVKRTINLMTGEIKIVKLVFFEKFIQEIRGFQIPFYRSPLKEARVLDTVRGNPLFMQGSSTSDSVGNNVRIIDFIRGPSLNKLVSGFNMSHEHFFKNRMLGLLKGICDCLQSLSYLHENNLVHGDVRWDHILFDRDQGIYRWIDFDYNYDFPANPFGMDLVGLGKIITYVIGMGGYFYSDIKANPKFKNEVDHLQPEDFSILEQNRLVNLKKIYPYIPTRLNNVLLHFSGYATVFYDSVDEVLHDLRDALRDLEDVTGNYLEE
ncbi:MAG: hypothetical protein KAQ71_13360 [Desulfobulbaceae bacterium]|nr:hypothetical protein [Desulfobulbaceae bacterium]